MKSNVNPLILYLLGKVITPHALCRTPILMREKEEPWLANKPLKHTPEMRDNPYRIRAAESSSNITFLTSATGCRAPVRRRTHVKLDQKRRIDESDAESWSATGYAVEMRFRNGLLQVPVSPKSSGAAADPQRAEVTDSAR
jgi:hypothetical protein